MSKNNIIEKYKCLAQGVTEGHTFSLSKEEWEEYQRIVQTCDKYGKTVEEYIDIFEEFQKMIEKDKEELYELSKYGDYPIDLDANSATEILIKTMKQYELDNDLSCEIIDKLNMIPNSQEIT